MSELALSIVVPMLNEEASVAPLIEAVREAMRGNPEWELILVDDGSTDRTPEIAQRLSSMDPRVRVLRLAHRYGQSTAMQAGFDHARAPVLVTMDGDLQNDPRDIPGLVAKLAEGYDLVAGYRVRRKDRLTTRKIPSWIANWIIARITGVPIRDNGCSLKAYRAEVLARMRLYSDFHRFIPAMAVGMAGARIAEVPVRHHPRIQGSSKYGLGRIFRVAVDLLTIKMIRSFRMRPLRLFSYPAGGAALLGLLAAAVSVTGYPGYGAGQAKSVVFPGIALLLLTLSIFLLLLGLVGETALRGDWGVGEPTRLLASEIRFE